MASDGGDGVERVQNNPIRSLTPLDDMASPITTTKEATGEGSFVLTLVPPTSRRLAQPLPAPSEANTETTVPLGAISSPTLLPTSLTFQPMVTQFLVNQTSPFFTPVVQHQLPFFPAAMEINQTPNTQPTFHVQPQSQIPTSTQLTLPPLAQAMTTPPSVSYSTTDPWGEPLLPFQQQPFYGPKTGYQAFYGYLGAPSYSTPHQYDAQGPLAIPNQDCLSWSDISLFSKELLDYKILNTAKLPNLKTYKGTTDPGSHIDTYEWTMTSLKLDQRFWCTYFSTTLDGNVGTWFKTLRPGSIYNFGQLKYLFLTKFMQLCKYKGDSHSIIGCKQKEVETTRAELKERVERYLRQEEGEVVKQVYLCTIAVKRYNPTHTEAPGGSRYSGRGKRPMGRFRPFVRDDRRSRRPEVYAVAYKQQEKASKGWY
uniref:Retrotransposon gag domain-containing protein n=1 Tax=Lactuca sativa TaxID=4236 RepID=A0A9R1V6W5_LACSA|nr:hypothetical protein LSAT_V11C600301160 [Lactuca sativa]